MNLLHRASQIFFKLLVFNGSVLFAMTLQRLVLFLVVVRHWLFGADGFTIAESFIAGLRFDICVLGFLNIPVLFLVWATSSDFMVHSTHSILTFLRKWSLWIYLGAVTLLIHVLGYFDIMFFAGQGHRWTFSDWQENGFYFVNQVSSRWGALFTFGMVLLFLFLWLFRCLMQLYRVQLHTLPLEADNKRQTKPVLILTGIFLPLFVVALAARGTWTAHHINIEHAQISSNQALNQLALSPLWAFDKKF